MQTSFLLLAQYGGLAVIPVDKICKDYFQHLTPENFVRKVDAGKINIPLLRIEGSEKAAKGVHVQDFARYLDERRAAAQREANALAS